MSARGPLKEFTIGLVLAALCLTLGVALATAALPAGNDGARSAEGPRILASSGIENFTLLATPRPVPEVRFLDRQGAARGLGDFLGRVVLLNLWATWCAPCRREMPTLDRLQVELGGEDFEVVALAVDRGGAAKVMAFLDEVGAPNLVPYIDATTRAMRALGAFGLPTTILIDRQGREIGRMIGPTEWDSPEAKALIRRAIAEDTSGAARATGAVRPPA